LIQWRGIFLTAAKGMGEGIQPAVFATVDLRIDHFH